LQRTPELPHTGLSAFAHVTADKSDLYRAVMGAFVAAKERFLVHLRPEDVAEHLRGGDRAIDGDEVASALRSLVGWGNLRADPDTQRVTTVEDFNRARFLYQLTAEGEAAEAALDAYDTALGRRGELQSVALADIRTLLMALAALARSDAADPAKAHQLLRDLTGVFESLAANAQAFMSSLQRTVDLTDVDLDAFLAYKDRLIGYLERFIGDLVVASGEIAILLAEVDRLGFEQLLQIVAQREVVDAAPDDPSADAALEHRLAVWGQRWAGLHQWFSGTAAHPSQASILRGRARQGITALLGLVATLNERRSGRSDRSADFRTLARWFAEADDDAKAHRLWRAAFALTPSRHLTIDAASLDARDADPVPSATPWSEAPPVVVGARLRATGSHERRGAPARIVDRSAARTALAAAVAAQSAQAEAARQRLVTSGPVRLSDLGELDGRAFRALLGLLGDALSAVTAPGQTISTTTADGALWVCLTPTRDGATACITTPEGDLHGPDHILEIQRTDDLVNRWEASA